jgi:O-acetyl-ADP-ribose deacetylase (regulator of RNase III)
LADAYRSSLRLADNSGFESLAFPSISTGVYGYPIEKAADVAMRTVIKFIRRPQRAIKVVRFVLFDLADYESYRQALASLVSL